MTRNLKPRAIELKTHVMDLTDCTQGWPSIIECTHDALAAHAYKRAVKEASERYALAISAQHVFDWIERRAAEILETEFGVKP